MVYSIYCVKDRHVGFLEPRIERDDSCAVRNFAMAVNNAPKDTLIGFAPKDFDLYRMGTFDSTKGIFDTCIPEFIVCANDLVGVDYEKAY